MIQNIYSTYQIKSYINFGQPHNFFQGKPHTKLSIYLYFFHFILLFFLFKIYDTILIKDAVVDMIMNECINF